MPGRQPPQAVVGERGNHTLAPEGTPYFPVSGFFPGAIALDALSGPDGQYHRTGVMVDNRNR